jgi:hypothetical protein
VLSVRGLDGGNIPAGVTVTPSADKATLTVTVSSSADPSDTTLEYEVADATNDPDRYVWGVINISVQDVPSAPQAPTRAAGFVSGTLTLSWPAPAANNSAITKYTVESDGGYRKECTSTICSLDGLPTGQRFRFTVSATNAIGTSLLSSWSEPLSADVVPAGPASVSISAVAGQQGLATISWSPVSTPSGGSAVTGYEVVVFENGSPRSTFTPTADQSSLSNIPVTPGASYFARVTSKNSAQTDYWNSTDSGTFIAPGAPSQVSITSVSNNASGATTLTWTAASAAGSAGTMRYFVSRVGSASEGCPSDYATRPSSGALQGTDGDKSPGNYYLGVFAVNDYGCSATVTSVEVLAAPIVTSVSCLIAPYSGTSTQCGAMLTPNAAFVLKLSGISLTPTPVGTVNYQVKAGNSNWLDLTANNADFVTGEYDSTRYADNNITAGAGQNVVVRACLTPTNCSAPSSALTVDIPTPTP